MAEPEKDENQGTTTSADAVRARIAEALSLLKKGDGDAKRAARVGLIKARRSARTCIPSEQVALANEIDAAMQTVEGKTPAKTEAKPA